MGTHLKLVVGHARLYPQIDSSWRSGDAIVHGPIGHVQIPLGQCHRKRHKIDAGAQVVALQLTVRVDGAF